MLCQKCTKPRNHCGYRVLLELLGRFELPTSSLPILLRLFCLILSCFVLKPETLAAQWFQAFLFCVLVSLILFLRMGFFDARMGFVWVLSSMVFLTHANALELHYALSLVLYRA